MSNDMTSFFALQQISFVLVNLSNLNQAEKKLSFNIVKIVFWGITMGVDIVPISPGDGESI